MHQLVYNPSLGIPAAGTISGSHGSGVIDPRRSKINIGSIGTIRIAHLLLAILCGIMLPLMSNDYEHYNLAIRNDERLF